MKALIKIEKNGVLASDLYKFLEVLTPFNKWVGRRLSEFSFIDGKDFQTFLSESTGGRPLTDYVLSIDTAKHIALAEKTEKGHQIRQYFIDVENTYRKQIERDAGKLTRRNMTDLIKDSGENERMHGHGYSTYTKLIYKKLGIEYVKQDNFRDTLTPDQLKMVDSYENIVEAYLRLGWEYDKIKDNLPDFIKNADKQIKD